MKARPGITACSPYQAVVNGRAWSERVVRGQQPGDPFGRETLTKKINSQAAGEGDRGKVNLQIHRTRVPALITGYSKQPFLKVVPAKGTAEQTVGEGERA